MSLCFLLFFSHTLSLPSSHLKPSVLEVLLAADLQGLRYTDSVEAALQMESATSSKTDTRTVQSQGGEEVFDAGQKQCSNNTDQ